MEEKAKRYYQLKQKQKEIDQELSELRAEIMSYCEKEGASEQIVGKYKVKLVHQERREYDSDKLYAALPDPDVWRMLSKPDASKIASLVKLNVISEEKIMDTFSVKSIALLQVDKI